jgi:NAD(P)-dependent dehydrogenase (short-subunit alcohol dehydrogenase family)
VALSWATASWATAQLTIRLVIDEGVKILLGLTCQRRPEEVVVAQIETLGGKVVADSGSVTGPDARTDLVTCTRPRFGRLDIVVNDAG